MKQEDENRFDRNAEISTGEFELVVKEAKRKSTSSIFSKRDYSVYKCVLKSVRMVKVLVKFYNVITKHKHYPARWLDVIDTMIEKGKGSLVSKLRVIQIIEADMQLLIRIFIGSRIEKNIETDDRLSQHGYGSRKGFSIESALSEKRLLLDNAKRAGHKMMHLMSDLEACYDR